MARFETDLQNETLRETVVQRRRGTTSPDPEKIPGPLRGPLGGFAVGLSREEKALRASKGQFSSERLSEGFPPLVLHLRSSSRNRADFREGDEEPLFSEVVPERASQSRSWNSQQYWGYL